MNDLARWASGALRDRLDEDGRPLGEIASPLYPGDTREARCPYAGSREGRAMNTSALSHWRTWRESCFATWAALAGPTPLVRDTYAAATACVVAPLHLPAGPLPVSTAILYKTTVGFHQTLTALILDHPGLGETPAHTLGDGPTFVAAVESGGWLVGRKQACAGPPADIAAGWEILTGQRPCPTGDPLPVARRDGAVDGIALVVALVLATQRLLATGNRAGLPDFGAAPDVTRWPLGARLWHGAPTPWLVAATTRPDRDPRAALGLARGRAPVIAAFLDRAATAPDHPALEAAFQLGHGALVGE